MADANTCVSTENPPLEPSSRNRTGIRRARPQLSCVACRQGKLKCDRSQPSCDQCVKRSREDSCVYLPPPPKVKSAQQNIKGRIRHLESLVVGLINERDNQPATADVKKRSSDDDGSPSDDGAAQGNLSSALGQLMMNGSKETSYVGSASWEAILDELKEFAEDVDDDYDDSAAIEATNVLDQFDFSSAQISFGMPIATTKRGLIAQLPHRSMVDRLVDSWFNSYDPFQSCVHTYTFRKEYEQFWRDPDSTPVMWLALLFSIMSVSTLLMLRKDLDDAMSPSLAGQQAGIWQRLSASSMALADIAKGNPHTLEAMIVYAESVFLRNDERQTRLWLVAGIILRVALKMGYHRDSDNFPNISPFRGEMRRRIWNTLYQMDVLVAFSIGLPSSVRGVMSDTKSPGNFTDEDLTPEMTELPQVRSLQEITNVSYTRAKAAMCRVFAVAQEASHSIVPPSWVEVMDMDGRLLKTLDELPDALRMQPLAPPTLKFPPNVLMSRYNLRFLFLKGRILLHRRFFKDCGDVDKHQARQSRKICLDAALEILHHQRTIWKACQPGGMMHPVRWYLSSLATYDFILAAMILSLALTQYYTGPERRNCLLDMTGQEEIKFRQECITALSALHQMWLRQGRQSRNIMRASRFLRVMIERTKTVHALDAAAAAGGEIEAVPQSVLEDMQFGQFVESYGTDLRYRAPDATGAETTNEVSSVENMLDMPVDVGIDWSFWDEQVHGQSSIGPGIFNEPSWAVPTVSGFLDPIDPAGQGFPDRLGFFGN